MLNASLTATFAPAPRQLAAWQAKRDILFVGMQFNVMKDHEENAEGERTKDEADQRHLGR